MSGATMPDRGHFACLSRRKRRERRLRAARAVATAVRPARSGKRPRRTRLEAFASPGCDVECLQPCASSFRAAPLSLLPPLPSLPSPARRRSAASPAASSVVEAAASRESAARLDAAGCSKKKRPFLAMYLDLRGRDALGGKRALRRRQSLRYFATDDADLALDRTDDGYLTKLGARKACAVCIRSGHKAYACPSLRCFACYETGHIVKSCPKAKVNCGCCGRRGHASSACIYTILYSAAREANWGQVRCLHCGKTGHINCHSLDASSLKHTRPKLPSCGSDGSQGDHTSQQRAPKHQRRLVAETTNGEAAPDRRISSMRAELRRQLQWQRGRSGAWWFEK